MALRLDDGYELPAPKRRYGSFTQTYPTFTEWLDGSTWELDCTDDLLCAPVNNFRASLYYQATVLGKVLRTKTVHRDTEQGPVTKLLVRADIAGPETGPEHY